jgi:hypothetical protein
LFLNVWDGGTKWQCGLLGVGGTKFYSNVLVLMLMRWWVILSLYLGAGSLAGKEEKLVALSQIGGPVPLAS